MRYALAACALLLGLCSSGAARADFPVAHRLLPGNLILAELPPLDDLDTPTKKRRQDDLLRRSLPEAPTSTMTVEEQDLMNNYPELHQKMLAKMRADVEIIYMSMLPTRARHMRLLKTIPALGRLTPTPFMLAFNASPKEEKKRILIAARTTSVAWPDTRTRGDLYYVFSRETVVEFEHCAVDVGVPQPVNVIVALHNRIAAASCPMTPAGYVDYWYWQRGAALGLFLRDLIAATHACRVRTAEIIEAIARVRDRECMSFWEANRVFTPSELNTLADVSEALLEPER